MCSGHAEIQGESFHFSSVVCARQAYLLEDRLCFAPDGGASGGSGGAVTKYIPLDRIPVRGMPRGYLPSPGIAPVDPR